MNYYTIVTADRGIPCSKADAEALQALLDDSGEPHGFEFTYQDGTGYMEAPENGTWEDVPDDAKFVLAHLMRKEKIKQLEFGCAFTADRLVPGCYGGTRFRFTSDGRTIEPMLVWPDCESPERAGRVMR